MKNKKPEDTYVYKKKFTLKRPEFGMPISCVCGKSFAHLGLKSISRRVALESFMTKDWTYFQIKKVANGFMLRSQAGHVYVFTQFEDLVSWISEQIEMRVADPNRHYKAGG